MFKYSWCHKQGSFSGHYFNQHCPTIPQYTGSWGNRYQETSCTYLVNLRRGGPGVNGGLQPENKIHRYFKNSAFLLDTENYYKKAGFRSDKSRHCAHIHI